MEILSVVAIVLSVIAIVKSNNLEDSLRRLESKYKNLTKDTNTQKSTTTPLTANGLPLPSVSHHVAPHGEEHVVPGAVHQEDNHNQVHGALQPVHKVPHVEPYKESEFIIWLKEDWLLKLGGVLVIMGVLFFLSLAFTKVDATGKVVIGFIFGLTLMITGFMYAKKQIIGGAAIHLIGAVVILITAYLAHQPQYDVFGAYAAMVLMFATTVSIMLTAFAYKRAQLAHVGLVMASIVPLLVSIGQNNFFGLLMYLLVVLLGVLWLAFVTEWRTLLALSLTILSVYSSMYITGGMGDAPLQDKEIFLLVVFGVIFYATSLFSIVRTGGVTGKTDGFVALLNAGFALLWIVSQASPELAPIIIAVLGLCYAVGFFLVYKVTNVYTSFFIYGGVALGMLTTSIMMELSGRSLAFVLLMMGGGVTVATYYLSNDKEVTKIIAFFNLLPLFYVLSSIYTIGGFINGGTGLLAAWKDFAVIFMAIGIYSWVYRYFKPKVIELAYVSLTVAVLLVIDVVWQVLHLITSYSFATELSFFIIGIGLTWFMDNLLHSDTVTEKVAYINILTFVGVLSSIARIGTGTSSYYAQPVADIWKDWVCVALVMTLAFTFYYMFTKRLTTLRYGGLIAGLFLIVTSVWQILHILIGGGLATFLSILIYTVVGLYNLWDGTQSNRETKIKLSRVWLGFVAARVILWDAWHTSSNAGDGIIVGVLICVVIGVLLLSSAFIIKKSAKVEQP